MNVREWLFGDDNEIDAEVKVHRGDKPDDEADDDERMKEDER